MNKLLKLRPFTGGIGVFLIVWFGQLVSLTGSGLTSFALGVWVYKSTGSVTQFSLILLSVMLPCILIYPVAGALVDRWNRRWCMIVSDSGAGITTAVLALLLATGSLEIWHIYLAVSLSSVFKAFQLPAYTASTSMLIPKKYLPRASCVVRSGEACAQLISPLLGGVLLGIVKLQGVILIDLVTFLFALTTLLLVRFPNTKTAAVSEDGKASIWQDVVYGWTYIAVRPGLLVLLILFALDNFVTGVFEVLLTPLVLTFASVTELGTIQSIGGVGMVLGNLAMTISGGPRSLIRGIFAFDLFAHMIILAFGLRTSLPLFALLNFLLFFSIPIINGCCDAIFLRKVTPEVQGRVFATIRMIWMLCIPLAYVVAVPLAERIFEPLMAKNGLLAGSIGEIIGVGTGRGIGLLFITMEIIAILVTVAAYRYPRLWFIEDELPDVI